MATMKKPIPIVSINESNTLLNGDLPKPEDPLGTDYNFKREIVWFPNVFGFGVLHLIAIYSLYLYYFKCNFPTFFFATFLGIAAGVGITGGVHRLWSHRAYKAKTPLKLIFLFFATIAGMNSAYRWILDHRQHHKYSDTDADPHNAKRGLFFSHIGWLMSRPHPLVKAKRRTIDMTDIQSDPLIMFQRKYFYYLYFVFGFLFPMLFPVYFFGETLWNGFFVSFLCRYIVVLNCAWTVNSLAHRWGTQPYDKEINPRESYLVAFLVVGEGWHNYHHSFPWDYKAAENAKGLLGLVFNLTTQVIELFAKIGWAYDLKTACDDVIRKKVARSGDGTHPMSKGVLDKVKCLTNCKQN